MNISEPFALARLSKPVGENSRQQFAPVLGVRNGLKRKRQEISVAVDGDSLSTYEINNGRILNSYPVPPDTTFACAPVSLRLKDRTRKTYYAAKRKEKTRVHLCKDKELDVGTSVTDYSQVLDEESPVAQLEVLLRDDEDELLICHENGSFAVYASDLTTKAIGGQLSVQNGEPHFLATRWLTLAEASKSILKARPDIIAAAEPDCSYIASVYKPSVQNKDSNIVYAIWQISASPAELKTAFPLEPVVTHQLQISAEHIALDREPARFLSRCSRVQFRLKGRFATFDLTHSIPQKSQDSLPTPSNQLSSLAVSDNLMLLSTSSSVQLYNSHFRSLQASLDWHDSGLKRKRSNGVNGPVMLVAYYPRLNRVIGVRRNVLVAIDLSVASGENDQSGMKQLSLLVGNIGRGQEQPAKASQPFNSTPLGSLTDLNKQAKNWAATVQALEDYAGSQDIHGFEAKFFDHLSDSLATGSDYKANYLLSKIFYVKLSSEDDDSGQISELKIVFPAFRVISWLASEGLLSARRLSKALSSSSKTTHTQPVPSGSIVGALIAADDTFAAMADCLAGWQYMEPEELSAAVRVLIRHALSQPRTIKDDELQNHNSTSIEKALTLSSDPIGRAERLPVTLVSCLAMVLEKFASVGSGKVVSLMRSTYQQQEVIALIQILRQQMFRSGYTRSLQTQLDQKLLDTHQKLDGEFSTNGHQSTDLSLSAMVTLLSCCLDSLGPAGIMSSGDEERFVETLLPELLSEVSRVMEAMEDSTFLQGILRETLRYSESVLGGKSKASSRVQRIADSEPQPGRIVTLYSEPSAGNNTDGDTRSLPLGLRAEGFIDSKKVRKGNGKAVERSRREMGALQDRLRTAYALEQLIL